MVKQGKGYKYTLITFIGATMAMVASVRTIPTLAATGWQQFAYVLFDLIVLAIPVCLIAGEFGAMFPGKGGPQLWAHQALGPKWGFVIAWILWVQMFPGLIMISSTLGPTVSEMLDLPQLANNHWFILLCIIAVVWVLTFLSLRFDVAKIGAQYGVWLGVYLPGVLMAILGCAAVCKVGVLHQSYLSNFSWHKLLPNLTNVKDLSYFNAVAFLFTGIILTSVYISELQDASQNYIKGLLISLFLIVILNIFNSFFVAAIVPNGKIELDNIAQPVVLYCQILHLPHFIVNIFSLLVALGIVLQMSSWLNGPLRTITQAARAGFLPAKWRFHIVNKYGVAPSLLIVQMVVLTLFGLLYAFTSNMNGIFLTLTDTTNVLYMTVYIILVVALWHLRVQQPQLRRPYRIGGHIKGNWPAYIVGLMLLVAVGLSTLSIFVSESIGNIILILVITIVLFSIPFIINAHKKPSWLKQVQQDLQQK